MRTRTMLQLFLYKFNFVSMWVVKRVVCWSVVEKKRLKSEKPELLILQKQDIQILKHPSKITINNHKNNLVLILS